MLRRLLLSTISISFALNLPANTVYTLTEGIRYAKAHAPEITALQAKSNAFEQAAIAAKRLPDPRMSLGAMNVPVDSFSMTKENMTQIQIGLSQAFPKGSSLKLKAKQDRTQAKAFEQTKDLSERSIIQTLRQTWLNYDFWHDDLHLLKKEQTLFQQLNEATLSALAQNDAKQSDAAQVSYELGLLSQKILVAKEKIASTKAQLARWLPIEDKTLETNFPKTKVPPFTNALEQLGRHPLLKQDQYQTEYAHQNIALAEQQYKPGFKVDVNYGLRSGKNGAGKRRTDFVGVGISFDLPFFTTNLQDRLVKASEQNYQSALANRQSDRDQLIADLNASTDTAQSLSEQNKLYQRKLIPSAKLYADASKVAYQNKQIDFDTLTKAYLKNYQTQINALRTKVNYQKTLVHLRYLLGDAS